jgi:hypothetical protein
MTRTLKTLCALVALAALAPAPAPARDVEAPLAGTVTATTYASSGAFHGAVDISGGTCGTTPVTTAAAGSLAWNVVINTSNTICYANLAIPQNEVRHTFADGFTFRLMHFNPSAASVDKTCDRCNIGKASSPGNPESEIHLQRDKSGTRDTSWYSGYTTTGEALTLGERVGIIG